MGVYEKRIGSTLVFNKEKESDIINKVEYLAKRHKLGLFIANLIRVAFDSPYKLESMEELRKVFKELEDYGISLDRHKFFNEVEKELRDIKIKVDAIYNMGLKLLILAQVGKVIGLEDRSKNLLSTQFILQRELNMVCDKLGISSGGFIYNSDKLRNIEEYAEEVLEFIINSYGDIINELKGKLVFDSGTDKGSRLVGDVDSDKNSGGNAEDTMESQDNKGSTDNEDSRDKEDEGYIDFGSADLEALSNFIGDN